MSERPPLASKPGQQAVHELCSELLPEQPDEAASNYWTSTWKATAWSAAEASAIEAQLLSSGLSDLMLGVGATLSIEDANREGTAAELEERLRARWLGDTDLMREASEMSASEDPNRMTMPELNLFIGKASLTQAGVKVRRLRPSDNRAGKTDSWTDDLSIFVTYENGKHQARQILTAKTCSYWTHSAGVMMERDVTSPSYYGGIDYRGHKPASRWCRDQSEVLAFANLARATAAQPTQK